jgi:hypothetical protein
MRRRQVFRQWLDHRIGIEVSPVPRRMARSMFSRGMLLALASATIVRSRGFMSGSPPPERAATVSSLMSRVKTLPRLASAAPFLCLIVCHLEWPDMRRTPLKPPILSFPVEFRIQNSEFGSAF